jgi:hypothetical protein
MAGRGPQTFQKRQKEQQRKEKRQDKLARREQRKLTGPAPEVDDAALIAEAAERREEAAYDAAAITASDGDQSPPSGRQQPA